MKADAVLAASFLRLARRFEAERLPLTGLAGSGVTCWQLDFAAALRAAFRHPAAGLGFSEGARLLSTMHTQLATLCGAEEHTRESLAEWAALMADLRRRGPQRSFAAAAAAEEGLALLGRQAQALADPLLLDDLLESGSGGEEQGAESEAAGRWPPLTLDQLAADVRRAAPDLFPPAAGSGGGGGAPGDGSIERQQQQGTQLRRRQAAVLGEVLYRRHRLRYEPFEWVYDGLQPLLLADVLRRRKGAPVALAGATAAVGARLGLPLLPLPAESGAATAGSLQLGAVAAAAGEALGPELASHVATRTPATAPPPSTWVLLVDDPGSSDPSSSSSSGPSDPRGSSTSSGNSGNSNDPSATADCYLDASTGVLLDAAGVRAKYPTAQLASPSDR
eukprot:scaffold2.g6874.t1